MPIGKNLLDSASWTSCLGLLLILLLSSAAAQTCTNDGDCNSRATSVYWNGTMCVCSGCSNSWQGSQCQDCPIRYDVFNDCAACNEPDYAPNTSYPNCVYNKCQKSIDCVDAQTRSVSGTILTGCVCVCRNQYTGPRCQTCPPQFDPSNCGSCATGYSGYPSCSLTCTNANCSFHATSVSGTAATGCTCTCANKWFGPNCSACPVGYNTSLGCGACSSGYDGYPNCSPVCDVNADCAGHANSVTGTKATGCTCVCRNGWTGSNCTSCPVGFNITSDCGACSAGFGGYPRCARLCDFSDCSNHASSVSGNIGTGCTCTCRSGWTNLTCGLCPYGFAPEPDCSNCIANYSGYPNCKRTCTTVDDCSNHATGVSGTEGNCQCSCRNKWTGTSCNSCLLPFAGSDCGQCAVGYSGYPNCIKDCDKTIDCNSHATHVEGFANGTCKCYCRNQWQDDKCSYCPAKYLENQDCGACAPAYNVSTYPECYALCTNQWNCSGHALVVDGDGYWGCSCVCRAKWYGPSCSDCSDLYDKTADCDRCISTRESFPDCYLKCTTAANCSNRATSVTGNTKIGCNCTCRNGWAGSQCQNCPLNYDNTGDCASCAVGYDTFPGCYLTCTNASNCSSRATAVSGNTNTGCSCTCRNKWGGSDCSTCPQYVNASKDCGACVDLYAGYPNCKRICTVAEDCSGTLHALGVSGLDGACVCTCRNSWSGSDCSICIPKYNTSTNCATCADAYETYPACYLKCTSPANCTDHAASVTGNANIGCTCTCRNKWTDGKCSTCPSNYDSAQDCGDCATGFASYPTCARICTNALDCNNHATTVSGLLPSCNCTCRNSWTGTSCNSCASKYNSTEDCGTCATNFKEYSTYPNCYSTCTVAANCNNHAVSVTGNQVEGCTCSCRNQWSGATCATCVANYTTASDCGACATGYVNYPQCPRACTVPIDCNNNANTVSGGEGSCVCTCKINFDGPSCGQCAAGYSNYPTCARICTNTLDCNNHATTVSGLLPSCNCTCRNSWTGTSCNSCATKFNSTEDCGTCATGFKEYSTYPNCYATCTVAANCNNRAVSVTGNQVEGCTCTCRNQWTGPTCATCIANYTTASDCGACAAGYIYYPQCPRACTDASDCSSHSQSVNGGDGNCTCTCKINYAGPSCGQCAPGYSNYPTCARICTNALDCNSNADNVTGLLPSCTCTCRNSWTGSACNQCAPRYVSTEDCGTCATGYTEYSYYPLCYPTCTVAANCTNHATAVAGNQVEQCNCTCRNQWTGPKCATCIANYSTAADCGACATGFVYYPQCPRACTHALDCNSHSIAVDGGDGNCTCTCQTNYAGPSCGQCAPGYSNYPTCARICTDALDCNSHSTNVSGLLPSCSCTCRNKWFGGSCNQCPIQYNSTSVGDCGTCSTGYSEYSTYPQCYPTCSLALNCSGHAVDVEGNQREQCNCTCRNQWTGPKCATCIANYSTAADCGACAVGYVYYPQCPRACTDALDCNGNSVAVVGGDGNCTCTCKFNFAGPSCGQCAAGYSNYPTCARICTDALDCNSNSVAVSGLLPSCNCTCRNGWFGSSCNNCPTKYNRTEDCGTCASGFREFSTYPQCYPTCTTAGNCSNHAFSVAGNQVQQCNCSCRNQWSGPSCATCIANYSSGNDCGTCAPGYVYYPQCPRACTDNLDCNGHSTAVDGGDGNCTCTCKINYAGPSCGECAPGYSNYPTCARICTDALDCNSHSVNVSGLLPSCSCTCRNSWAGPACSSCATRYNSSEDCGTCATNFREYSTYPSCYSTCTVAANCTNHATAVAGNQVEQCNCTCRNQWTGPKCATCIANYSTSADCGTCAPGYVYYPQCPRACTDNLDCNGHSTAVDGGDGNCTCTCKINYAGPSCGECAPGYDNYPTCARICTDALDCNSHSVNVSGLVPNCVCTCRNSWTGPSCNSCASKYNSSEDCGTCATNFKEYSTYPSCFPTCTVAANCTNHATAVAGNQVEQCNCSCRNQWTGPTCATCIANYSTAADCGACATGFVYYPQCPRACTNILDCNNHSVAVDGGDNNCTCTCSSRYSGSRCDACAGGFGGYPLCPRLCTDELDCNSHSTAVVGLYPNCTCTCRNSWFGPSCNSCASRYNSTEDCGTCATGFNEYSTYPSCFVTCSTVSNCSSHAVSVAGNQVEGCNCTCRNQWFGPTCNQCGPFHNSSMDCGACIEGHILYPSCPRACTVNTDCNSHATTVSGPEGLCNCTCRNQWTNSSCDVCPPLYNATKDCGACRDQYDPLTYPACYLLCTPAANCTDHAVSVTGNTNTGCSCNCRNSWNGSTCSSCPPLVNSSKDCGACIDGYDGYPNCRRICTSALDCNDRARYATGLVPDCTCACRNMWRGNQCENCAAVYNSSEDCGTCVAGREEYPSCYRTCTSQDDCSNHSTAVAGNDNTGCSCTCRNSWSTSNCSVCEIQYNVTKDCGTCADGYVNYPRCDRVCTNAIDCSLHASNVTELFPNCNCTCRNGWSRSDCSVCPVNYDISNDCYGCAPGYEGEFPECYLSCTVAANCSGRAVSVVGNTKVGCNCSCRNQWNKTTNCAVCPVKYDPLQDCGNCDYGYEDYPVCRRACTTYYECSNHAVSVRGIWPNCSCTCRNQWNSSDCSYCDRIYDNKSDCGACAPDREQYPICLPSCTVRNNCSNNAFSATGNAITGCTCRCRGSWGGPTCDRCPALIDPNQDCSACIKGYGGYPNCAKICSAHDCNNRSLAVRGNFPNCQCYCRNGYTGANCSTCPPSHNATEDCDPCSDGYEDYPNCYRTCTNELDCSNHSYPNVTGNLDTGCGCSCRNFWTGANCSECPIQYDPASDCNSCSAGYVNFPQCDRVCTNKTDCSSNAVNVTGLAPGCNCTCRNKWEGPQCNRCPIIFDGFQDCGVCAKWVLGLERYEPYPNCTALSTPAKTLTHTFSETPESDTLTGTGTLSETRDRWTESRKLTVTKSLDVIPTTLAPPNTTMAPSNETTTAAPPNATEGNSTLVPSTSTSVPNSTTAPNFNSTTPQPTAANTTAAPMNVTTPTLAPTGTIAQNTTFRPTTGTPVTTTVAPTSAPPNTTSVPTTPLPTGPCDISTQCNAEGTAQMLGVQQPNCTCVCRNNYRSPDCSICDPWFNRSTGCDRCADGHITYPSCLVAVHVVGNFTIAACSALSQTNDATLKGLVTKDLNASLLTSLKDRCFANMTGNPVTLVQVVVPEMFRGLSTVSFEFDVAIWNQTKGWASWAATCVSTALNQNNVLPATLTVTRKRFQDLGMTDVANCFLGGGAFLSYTSETSACGAAGCSSAVDPPAATSSSSSFPLWAIGVIAGVIALLLLAIAGYFLFRRLFVKADHRAAFTDAGKYTINFLDAVEDEELRLMTERRELEFDDI